MLSCPRARRPCFGPGALLGLLPPIKRSTTNLWPGRAMARRGWNRTGGSRALDVLALGQHHPVCGSDHRPDPGISISPSRGRHAGLSISMSRRSAEAEAQVAETTCRAQSGSTPAKARRNRQELSQGWGAHKPKRSTGPKNQPKRPLRSTRPSLPVTRAHHRAHRRAQQASVDSSGLKLTYDQHPGVVAAVDASIVRPRLSAIRPGQAAISPLPHARERRCLTRGGQFPPQRMGGLPIVCRPQGSSRLSISSAGGYTAPTTESRPSKVPARRPHPPAGSRPCRRLHWRAVSNDRIDDLHTLELSRSCCKSHQFAQLFNPL